MPTCFKRFLRFLVVTTVAGLCVATSRGSDDTNTVYLFSYFTDERSGLCFAYSFDGWHWTNVAGTFLIPQVGGKLMRDPSIARGQDGEWHLVWTTAWRNENGFGYAHSKDFVHWSEQQFIPAMQHEPAVHNVWAPELFYDEKEKQFIICWASTIPGRFPEHGEPRDNNHRMFFTTTRDFKTFAPTKLYLDPGFSVIDCKILKDGDRYVLLLKDNSRPQCNIRIAFAETPLGPWKDFSAPFTKQYAEGPCALKIGDDWLIYYEAYRAKHYCAAKTRDFTDFTDVTADMTFPQPMKHGTAFKASTQDLDRLLKDSKTEQLPVSTSVLQTTNLPATQTSSNHVR